jgi:sporulation integral membrane protein YlbJ
MLIKKNEIKMLEISLIAVLITVLIVIFSEDAFYAAVEGLRVWWEIVFPSLLPFFIIAEILMGLGVVHFMGALLEPLMRPLFKVPGVGAFAMSMGLASGYPIGAKITSNLRRKNLCSKTEAERLISFTNTADPLFMIGAVAVGMFHRADLGIIIAGSHYISSILLGFIMRFYKSSEKENREFINTNTGNNIFINAIQELITARKNDGRTFGELLGDSVRESINTLLLVGGFIILFSVITRIILITGIINVLNGVILLFLRPLGITQSMTLPIISGLFEITNGTNLASQASAPLLQQLIITNAIIAWSGLSVHAQVATMIKGTDIKLKPYVIARIIQSFLSGRITIILYRGVKSTIKTTFLPLVLSQFNSSDYILLSLSLIFLIIIISIIISIIIYLIQKI